MSVVEWELNEQTNGRVFGAGGRRPALVTPVEVPSSVARPGVRLGAVGDAARRGGDLGEAVARASPVSFAVERTLPVLDALAPLLPGGALQRGTVTSVSTQPQSGGTTSLALALTTGASVAGSWCAAVGLPHLGLVAASELGMVLDRLVLVPRPFAAGWATVVAALIDAVDVVLVAPPPRMQAIDARRLRSRARERGSALVAVGSRWGESPDVELICGRSVWSGLGRGHGALRARRMTIEVSGRGRAARGCRTELWLPHPEGGVRAVLRSETGPPAAMARAG
ncbi:MAG TPA: hypothetical protein VGA13_07990 [Acidimicrobiales bacterium]